MLQKATICWVEHGTTIFTQYAKVLSHTTAFTTQGYLGVHVQVFIWRAAYSRVPCNK